MRTRLRVTTQTCHQGQVQVEFLNQPILAQLQAVCFTLFIWCFMSIYGWFMAVLWLSCGLVHSINQGVIFLEGKQWHLPMRKKKTKTLVTQRRHLLHCCRRAASGVTLSVMPRFSPKNYRHQTFYSTILVREH